jgi:phage gpG-like protein
VFRVQVEDKELLAKVRKAKQEVYRKVMGELLIGAKEIQSNAREIVPVRKNFLKPSIIHEPIEDGFVVGSNSKYANYIEFGEPQGTGPNGGPRPYLRPAFHNNKENIRRRVIALIRKLL